MLPAGQLADEHSNETGWEAVRLARPNNPIQEHNAAEIERCLVERYNWSVADAEEEGFKTFRVLLDSSAARRARREQKSAQTKESETEQCSSLYHEKKHSFQEGGSAIERCLMERYDWSVEDAARVATDMMSAWQKRAAAEWARLEAAEDSRNGQR